jgi:hypothetical protein
MKQADPGPPVEKCSSGNAVRRKRNESTNFTGKSELLKPFNIGGD